MDNFYCPKSGFFVCWIGAAITAGAGLLNGIFNRSSTSSANRQNIAFSKWKTEYDANQALQMANLQYRQQQGLNNQALAHNKELTELQDFLQQQQWTRENEYNTPEAQMQRYLEAGINPYNALGNISSGNASSYTPSSVTGSPAGSSSSVAAPQAAMPNIQSEAGSFDTTSESFSAAGNLVFQSLSNPFTNPNTKDAAYRGYKARQLQDRYQAFVDGQTANNKIGAMALQNRLLSAQILEKQNSASLKYFQSAIAEVQALKMPQQAQMEIMQYGIEFWNAVRDGDIKEKQAKLLIQQRLESIARELGIHLDNKQKRACLEFVIKAADFGARRAEQEYNFLKAYGTPNPTQYQVEDIGGELKGEFSTPVWTIGGSGHVNRQTKGYKKIE